jgi:hypothetical protein
MPAPPRQHAGTASQLIPGVRRTRRMARGANGPMMIRCVALVVLALVAAVQPSAGVDALVAQADIVQMQLLAAASVADQANPDVAVACVWAAPPMGDPSGALDSGSRLRAVREELLDRVRLRHPRELKPGSACSGGIGGVKEATSGRPAFWVFVQAPRLDGSSASVESGVYCGGKCGWTYRYSLVRKNDRWLVVQQKQVRQS